MSKAVSVKALCEEGILAGKSAVVLMNGLRKSTDKDDATLEKSVKYYASALHREGKIDDEAKAKYVGKSGRGKSASALAAADDKPAKKSRKGKAADADTDTPPAKKARKSKAPKADEAPAEDAPVRKPRKTRASKVADEAPAEDAPVKKARTKKSKAQS